VVIMVQANATVSGPVWPPAEAARMLPLAGSGPSVGNRSLDVQFLRVRCHLSNETERR